MSVVQTLIGNVKGPQGATGATGATGPQGDAATINVGSVSTTAYGNPAQVVNVGTENEAVLNFVIPQGKPGQATTTMGGLTLDTITTSMADFPSPQVGDTGATAFGKIVKFFADALSALNSKLNTANVVNNLTTTEAGYALDARAGKTLNDSFTNTDNTGLSFVESSNISSASASFSRQGNMALFKLSFTYSGSANTEKSIGTISGIRGSGIGIVINRSTSQTVGSFQFTAGDSGSSTVYINVSTTGNMALSCLCFVHNA